MSNRGSILLEAVLSFGLVIVPLIGLNLELIRAAQYQVLFQHLSFLMARSVVLASGPSNFMFQQACLRVTIGLGEAERRRICRQTDYFIDWFAGRWVQVRVRYRYAGFLPQFNYRPQLTEKCLFSL